MSKDSKDLYDAIQDFKRVLKDEFTLKVFIKLYVVYLIVGITLGYLMGRI